MSKKKSKKIRKEQAQELSSAEPEHPDWRQKKQQPLTAASKIRTIAMDYWSVLEYELYYKKRDNAEIEAELKKYAEEIANLDHRMLELRNKIEKI